MLTLAFCCSLCLAIAQAAEAESMAQPPDTAESQTQAAPAAVPVDSLPLVEWTTDSFPYRTKPVTISPVALADDAPNAADLGIPAPEGRLGIDDTRYSSDVFVRQALSIPWRLGGATAAITLTGIANWNWGSSSFHFHREGWFGKHTKSLGMDKLGHGYSAFVLTEFFSDGIVKSTADRRHGFYTAGLLAIGMMTYIEVFDGFSKDHGFSPEDLAVDAAGVAFSIIRRAVPGLREKVDFRLLYTPDKATFASLRCFPRPSCDREGKTTARSPVTDYSNQRYLLAFKLAGFKPLDRTPLRLVELHAGYYARGFTAEAEARGDPLRRRLFLGVGVNVGELLFPKRHGWLGKAARSALEYLQVPRTAVYTH